MPRKIVPVPGIPPHEWHNHQPSSGEEEVKQDNMAPHENSVNIKTETIDPQEPGLAESQKPHGPKGGLKQWQTTTDDPTRLHRLMRDGYGEPLRAGISARLGDVEPAGRLLYPHEAVAAIRPPSPEPARPVRQHVLESRETHYDDSRAVKIVPLKVWQGPQQSPATAEAQARHASNPEADRSRAWREYAANPESLSRQRSQEIPETTTVQPRKPTNPEPRRVSDQTDERDFALGQSRKAPESTLTREQYFTGLGPRSVHDQPDQQAIHEKVYPRNGGPLTSNLCPTEHYERAHDQESKPEKVYPIRGGPRILHDQPEHDSESVKSEQEAPRRQYEMKVHPRESFEQHEVKQESSQPDLKHQDERDYKTKTGPSFVFSWPEDTHKAISSATNTESILPRRFDPKREPLGLQRRLDLDPERVGSDRDSESVAPAPMRSPDLAQIQIPRPNRNAVNSVRSMVSVLSLDEAENARRDAEYEQSTTKYSDIRSKIGFEPSLHVSGGKLINTDIWAEKARKPEDIYLNPVYANPWIEDYVENQVDYDVRANFLCEEDSTVHCHCDVDTFSGKLLNPIQYDHTFPDYNNSDSMDRQMTRTASLYVQRKNIKQAARRNNNPGPYRPPPGWVDTPAPMSTTTPEPVQQKPLKTAAPLQRARAASDLDPFSPRIPCHVRPAHQEDMTGVQGIYNWEVMNGLQALDTEPLSLADWEGILKKTEDDKLPFIVVIGGKHKGPDDRTQTILDGRLLAFGFLTVRQPGLAGSFSGTSRMSAKALVFVHPDHRRLKLGHVCLDKLLSTVSTRYSTKLGYEFLNLYNNPTYKYPSNHDRKIYSVFVEYFVPRTREHGSAKFEPDETDLKWFERIVTSRYGFWKVARLEAAHRSRTTYEPAPIWLDTVMFEHMCQEGMGFTHAL